ncbi:hypothetical protein LTR53_010626 [Teratosphaeriaceae sp. CCFEE 6253]|nr:hypothetical protein LTR53_010626 [Teratosphaeriaceae sp. CCFEE 6253]
MFTCDSTVGSLLRTFRPDEQHSQQKPSSFGRSFTTLPAEIRNQIYEELLVAGSVINLTALRSQGARSPRTERYGLAVHLLVVCRQVYCEALPILYGQNAFYYDLEAMWGYHRPKAWRVRFDLELDDLYTCLKCQMYQDIKNDLGTPALDTHLGQDAVWSPNIKLVRRLQVTLNAFSYPEWRYRHRTAFPRHNFTCPHSVRFSLPQHLQADLLVIRSPSRALMSGAEGSIGQNWYNIAARYHSTDAQQWRRRCDRDRARDYTDLVAYAQIHARYVILTGTKPRIESSAHEGVPGYIREFLRTGLFSVQRAIEPLNEQLPSEALEGLIEQAL